MTQSLPPKSVLPYADDDPDDRALPIGIFADYEGVVELLTFRNGASLLEHISRLKRQQVQPALITLDINMPELDGFATLRRPGLDDDAAAIQKVLFTISMQPHDNSSVRQPGAGFITKPLNISQLQQVAGKMLNYCDDEVKQKIIRLRGKIKTRSSAPVSSTRPKAFATQH